MSEGVKILISADDQASKVLAKVSDTVDDKVKRIKTVGQGAKASTEFIGTLANSLGGTVIGSYAAGIAQLTERIGNFSEVSKAGTAGALAFKAGLAGVALVAGFKIGTMIGDWVFETARWKDELAGANEQLMQSADNLARMDSFRLSLRAEKASLLGEVESRKLMNQLSSEALKIEARIAETKKEQAKDNEGIVGWARFISGNAEAIAEANKAELAIDEKRLDVINKEKEALTQKLSPYAKEIEALREINALKQRNDDYIKSLSNEVELLKASKEERAAIEAIQKSGGDREAAAKIEALLREKELLEAKRDAERKIETKLKETELRTAAQSGLQPLQSRLLTRGPVENGIDKVAKNTESTVKQLERIYERLPLPMSTSESLKLEFVS